MFLRLRSASTFSRSCPFASPSCFHSSPQRLLARTRGVPPGRKPLAATTIAVPNTERKEAQPLVRDDVQLNTFLTKIYTTTGWGILGMFGSAQLLTATGLAYSVSPMMLMGTGLLGAVGSTMALSKME